MRRNPDLIRQIALATEALKPNEKLNRIEGVDQFEFAAHVKFMKDAGLIEGSTSTSVDGKSHNAIITRLTWAGCDFLDAARSETLWKKAKESVIAPTASWTFDILKEWLKAEIGKGLPTLRGLTN